MEFKKIVQERYACKKFTGEEIPKKKIDELLEIIRLSPSSFNLQPWKIKVIKDNETKEKLLPASWNQPQIITSSHILIFFTNKNILENIEKLIKQMKDSGIPEENVKNFENYVMKFYNNLSDEQKIAWAQKQVYLAVANALNGTKSLGFDSCPMEGFNPEEYSKILKTPQNLIPTVVVPIGIAADKQRKKLRFKKEEIFF